MTVPDVLAFYVLAVLILVSASMVILAPRMYLSVVSLFFLVIFSSFLYFGLNASYIAIFQFLLCGLCLFLYIFLLLKKIGRLNLRLKLVSPFKLVFRTFFVFIFGVLTYLFFVEEFSNSLFDVFSFVSEKSSDVIDFATHIFPLHLVLILVVISAIVIRIFLLSYQNSEAISEDSKQKEGKND